MRVRLLMATCLVLMIGSTAAVAQTSSSSSSKHGPWPAPVGHRQPRADQVPQEKDSSSATSAADKESREDAALDRKIKSICRGC